MTAGPRRSGIRWNHRRLGIDDNRQPEAVLAAVDAALDAIGRREHTTMAPRNDPVLSALASYVADIDTSIDVENAPDRVVDAAAGRPVPSRRRQTAWASLGLAVLAATGLGIAALRPTSPDSFRARPAVDASVEAHQLLRHATGLLSTAAARPGDRDALVREARADLVHAATLVPLVPPGERTSDRMTLRALDHRSAALQRSAPAQRPDDGAPPSQGSSGPRAPVPGSAAHHQRGRQPHQPPAGRPQTHAGQRHQPSARSHPTTGTASGRTRHSPRHGSRTAGRGPRAERHRGTGHASHSGRPTTHEETA